MEKLQVGDFLLYKNRQGILPAIIRTTTQSPYSHVSVVVGKSLLDDSYYKIAEATANGFVYTWVHLSDIIGENASIDAYRLVKRPNYLTDEMIKQAVARRIGTPYGFLDLLGILIYILSGKNLFKKRSEAMTCSESCADMLAEFNIFLIKGKDLDLITPADFAASDKLRKLYFIN